MKLRTVSVPRYIDHLSFPLILLFCQLASPFYWTDCPPPFPLLKPTSPPDEQSRQVLVSEWLPHPGLCGPLPLFTDQVLAVGPSPLLCAANTQVRLPMSLSDGQLIVTGLPSRTPLHLCDPRLRRRFSRTDERRQYVCAPFAEPSLSFSGHPLFYFLLHFFLFLSLPLGPSFPRPLIPFPPPPLKSLHTA